MTKFVFSIIAIIAIFLVQASACKQTPLASDITQSQTADAALVRGIWVSHPDILPKPNESISSVKQRIKDLARKLTRLNFNTVYLSVYGDGKLFWPSPAMQKAGGLTTQMNWANEARQIFRDEGLWVAAWFEYGLAVGPGNHPLALAHPDWLQQRQNGQIATTEPGHPGEYFVFLSPAHAEVHALLTRLIQELAGMGFDEIQFDRIRYGAGQNTGREYGYERVSLEYYSHTNKGKEAPTDINEPHWVDFRQDLVSLLVGNLSSSAYKTSPKLILSASPVGHYGIARHMQWWSAWLNKNYISIAFPQAYGKDMLETKTIIDKLYDYAKDNALHKKRKFGIGVKLSSKADLVNILLHARSKGIYDYIIWPYIDGKNASTAAMDFLLEDDVLHAIPATNPFRVAVWTKK